MNVVVFSKAGLSYDNSRKGDITALFVPSQIDVRSYTDIPNINKNTVRERYGDIGLAPLYRVSADTVTVYGSIPEELAERRQSIEVMLPHDFVPAHCAHFFFVFGNKVIIQGEKTFTDNGKEEWGMTLHTVEKDLDILLESLVSDLLFEGETSSLCIAAMVEARLYQTLQEKMEDLGQNLVRFDSLSRQRNAMPLYAHRDYGLGMLIAGMLSFLVLGASLVYMGVKLANLQNIETELGTLEQQIAKQKENRPLSHISDPKAILRLMSKPLPQQPSAVLHAAADAASSFGVLQDVQMSVILSDRDLRRMETIDVDASVGLGNGDELLIDQEQVAEAVLSTRPWVREVERIPGKDLKLKIGVQVK